MSFIRRLLLPTVIGTPLVLWVMPVAFRGLSSLTEFNVGHVRLADWALAFLLTLIGLSLIGLPSARYVASLKMPLSAKGVFVLGAGVVGGGLVAMLYILLIAILAAVSGEEIDFAAIGETLSIAPSGFLPGAVVAAAWLALNFNSLAPKRDA